MPLSTSYSQLAEEFIKFFHTKIKKNREKFKDIEPYQPKQLDVPPLRKFTPVTTSQLEKKIRGMPLKTCQLDIIPTDKLKEVLEGCLPAVTHVTNSSLDTSSFCEELKEAIVKPLVRKPSGGLIKKNYRPVSNLGFISKVVENVTLEQFTEHCSQNSVLPQYPSAYRKEHSCKTSLVKLVNEMLWGIENQLVAAVVILDLSAAFDTVYNDLFLDVLEKRFGTTDAARKWYHNYLKTRKFRVLIEKDKSQLR